MFENLKKTGTDLLFKISKNSPTLLIIAGGTLAIAGTALACKATLDIQEPLKKAKNDINDIKEDKEAGVYDENPEMNYRKDLTTAYVETGVMLAKHYALPVTLEILAIGTLFASDRISRERNAKLAAAVCTANEMYKKYRQNVIDTYGNDVDMQMLTGAKKERKNVITTDEDGNETKEKQDILELNRTAINPLDTPFARFFDESSVHWSKSFMANQSFLRIQENQVNERLRCRGYLFVNDVLDILDLPKTDIGWDYGWIYDPDKVHQITFGIYDVYDEAKRNFVNGYERNVLITLDPEDYIRDKVFMPRNNFNRAIHNFKCDRIDIHK